MHKFAFAFAFAFVTATVAGLRDRLTVAGNCVAATVTGGAGARQQSWHWRLQAENGPLPLETPAPGSSTRDSVRPCVRDGL